MYLLVPLYDYLNMLGQFLSILELVFVDIQNQLHDLSNLS